MLSRVNIPAIQRTVDGTLFNEKDAIFRQAPSDEVDAGWNRVSEIGIVTISGEEVSRLGKDPRKTVKAPVEWGERIPLDIVLHCHRSITLTSSMLTVDAGLGSDAHLAQIDGQHAIHCLNAVRRYAYREYYFPTSDTNTTEIKGDEADRKSPLAPIHQAHLSHCLHILLQALTCNPSTDLITHNWMRTQSYPTPDFGIHKKCRNHDTVLQWQEKNMLSEDQWVEMSKRGPGEGESWIEMPPLMKEWVDKDGGDAHVHE